MKIKYKRFRLAAPKLPSLHVYHPTVEWYDGEDYDAIVLSENITSFEEAYAEAQVKYYERKEYDLKRLVSMELPDEWVKKLTETYPTKIEITYKEIRKYPDMVIP